MSNLINNLPDSSPVGEGSTLMLDQFVQRSGGKYSMSDLDWTAHVNEHDSVLAHKRVLLDPLITGFNYFFITSPELTIAKDIINNRSISGFQGSANHSIDILQKIIEENRLALEIESPSIYTEEMVNVLAGLKSPFINILCNRAQSAVFSDETLNTQDYGETWARYKIVIGTQAKESRIGGNFTINYAEDQYLTVIKLHKLWIDYIEKAFVGDVINGQVVLSDDLVSNSMRSIDYVTSIYKFTTMPDGKTLQSWAKYTGTFPTKVPWGEFTSEAGSQEVKKSIPIEYQFSFKEDTKMSILRDFNLTSMRTSVSNYTGDTYTGSPSSIPQPTDMSIPFVAMVNERGERINGTSTGEHTRFQLFFPDA